MGGGPDAQKNYTALFKAEKENYEILNYKFKLEDAEDAFLAKFRTHKIWTNALINLVKKKFIYIKHIFIAIIKSKKLKLFGSFNVTFLE